jgi:hypothetical protein
MAIEQTFQMSQGNEDDEKQTWNICVRGKKSTSQEI